MTRDDIIRMAREAGIPETATEGVFIANSDDLGRLMAAEREACIKLIEDFSKTTMVPVRDTWVMGLIAGANSLRARGQHE
jgi:hypothetical protein